MNCKADACAGAGRGGEAQDGGIGGLRQEGGPWMEQWYDWKASATSCNRSGLQKWEDQMFRESWFYVGESHPVELAGQCRGNNSTDICKAPGTSGSKASHWSVSEHTFLIRCTRSEKHALGGCHRSSFWVCFGIQCVFVCLSCCALP
jgi:hypothetical protein